MAADKTSSLDGSANKPLGSLALTTTPKEWAFAIPVGAPRVQFIQMYSDVAWQYSDAVGGNYFDITAGSYINIRLPKDMSLFLQVPTGTGTVQAHLLPH